MPHAMDHGCGFYPIPSYTPACFWKVELGTDITTPGSAVHTWMTKGVKGKTCSKGPQVGGHEDGVPMSWSRGMST